MAARRASILLGAAMMLAVVICCAGRRASYNGLVEGLGDPKYAVAIHSARAQILPGPGTRMIPMTRADGQRYMCSIPEPPVADDEDGEDRGDDAATTPANGDGDPSIAKVLAPLNNKCLFRTTGWWTYEFCRGGHVRQYHQEQDQASPVAEFFLGYFPLDDNADINDVAGIGKYVDGEADGIATPGPPYYAETYTGGTKCDINGQRRQVEVHYQCGPDNINRLTTIKEPASCEYVVVIHTPLVCGHDAFVLEEEPLATINCVMVDADGKEVGGDDADPIMSDGRGMAGSTAASGSPPPAGSGAEAPGSADSASLRDTAVDAAVAAASQTAAKVRATTSSAEARRLAPAISAALRALGEQQHEEYQAQLQRARQQQEARTKAAAAKTESQGDAPAASKDGAKKGKQAPSVVLTPDQVSPELRNLVLEAVEELFRQTNAAAAGNPIPESELRFSAKELKELIKMAEESGVMTRDANGNLGYTIKGDGLRPSSNVGAAAARGDGPSGGDGANSGTKAAQTDAPTPPPASTGDEGLTAGEARLRELQEKRGADKGSGKKKAGKSK